MDGRAATEAAHGADERVLLVSKLHPPMPRALLDRPRLLARLHPTGHRLTVLDAPAGWGKTALLTQWRAAVADGGPRVAWLALDPADDDPVLFWTYVVAALRTAAPGVGARTLAALAAGGRAVREAAIPALVADLHAVPGPLVLVLDDQHVITGSDVHDGVALLLEHLPPHVHLVVAARGDPHLPLGRLRAAGELLELRADDLAFDTAEVRALLTRQPGVVLADDDVARLARRTEGWPAGVALAAASLRARRADAARFVAEFTGTDRFVLDYLGEEVLAQQPPARREFLLRTSILRRLTPALCAAVTGRADAAAELDALARDGVFVVALDGARQWFRYHRLFGELLRHELGLTDPTAVRGLHRRAAAWCAGHGAVTDAVAHHVAAGDVAAAVEVVAAHWLDYFNAGRLGTVGGWLDALPAAAVRADWRLCAARAWLALDLGRVDEADAWLDTGDRAAGDGAPPGGGAGLDALRDLAVLRAVTRFKIGDLGAARAAARRVAELGAGEASFAATVAHLITGIGAFWQGEPAAAHRPLARAVRLARRTGNALGETYGLGYLALLAAEEGDLAEAAGAVPAALERAAEPAVAEHFVAALPHLAQAVLLGATGRPEPAAGAAARALALARRGAGRLELALALGVSARALAAVDPTGAGGAEAGRLLDRARALARGCPDPGTLPIRLARIRVAPTRPAAPAEPAAEAVALSDRERELLPLLAGTLSQREIGAVLHLSLNTVKTHSRLLFRKLGVSSRAGAVRRARELGLL